MLPGKCRSCPCPLPPSGTSAARQIPAQWVRAPGSPPDPSATGAQVCAPKGPAHPAPAGVSLPSSFLHDSHCWGDTRVDSKPPWAAGDVGWAGPFRACLLSLTAPRVTPCVSHAPTPHAPSNPRPTCLGGGGGRDARIHRDVSSPVVTTARLSPNGVFELRNRRVDLGRGRTKRTVEGTERCVCPDPGVRGFV